MFSSQKIKGYVFLFLAFCVFSSKGIIIYNEETLVALSFYTFVLFCFHYFGDTIKESLEERALTIKEELHNFLHYKQESLVELSQEHKKISQLQSILPSIGSFTQAQLSKLSLSGQETLNSIFTEQVKQRLAHLSLSKSTLQQHLQEHIANNIETLVLAKIEEIQRSGKENYLDTQMIKQSIGLLKNRN